MIDFLNKIGASEELIESLKDATHQAHIEKETNKIRVTFSNVTHLTPAKYIELYSKVRSIVETSMGKELSLINFEIEAKNDLIHIYENIREYFTKELPQLNLAHIHISFDETDNLVISTSKEDSRDKVDGIIENLKDYLHNFSITNKHIKVELNKELFSINKLDKIIEDSKPEFISVPQRNSIIDEKIREGYVPINFDDPSDVQSKVFFQGRINEIEEINSKNGNIFYSFLLSSNNQAVRVTVFDKFKQMPPISDGDAIRVYGKYELSEFHKEKILTAFRPTEDLQKISTNTVGKIPEDDTEYVRHEFHVHTKMSTLDGASDVKDYIKYAEAYKLGSITITDHNNAQAFPDAYNASKGTDVIINYGVEMDVYDDLNTKVVINERDQQLVDAEYIFFDLETTSISAWLSEIIEFGGVKYRNNQITDRRQLFIKPTGPISEFTTSLTSITNEDVANAPSIDEAIKEIKEWIGDSILVAHNASFDFNFLNKAFIDAGLGPIENPIIDTMKLSWFFHPKSRSHRLGVLAKNELVPYDDMAAHRADYDAEVLAKIFERLIHKLLTSDIRNLNSINEMTGDLTDYYFPKHINLISKNQEGLRDINEIISKASIEFFNRRRKSASLPLSFFTNKEERLLKNILVGSSCSNGFLFEAILDSDWPLAESIIEIYDYLEIFPPTAYKHLINTNKITEKDLKKVLRKIKELGDKNNIPVIVTSNAHYSSKDDKIVRDILISAKRVGGGAHPLHNFRNPGLEKPDNHLRSTTEIFKEFKGWFKDEEIHEMVITNPAVLQSQITNQKPIHDELFKPELPDAEKELQERIKQNMERMYGANPAPEIVDRLNRELNPLIEHGYAVIYYLSAIAIDESMKQGYLVGSRGSVGSSFAATMSGVTEVNPLRPHYRCPKCKHHEFNNDVDSGYDLPNKACPVCGEIMIGDGHSIPFETFLGFNADKVPDIDLNFSRDNQSSIHQFMKEYLGEENVFRAGTISTAAPKTAFGYAMSYQELTNQTFNKATTEILAQRVEGAKRTTSQHPGGLIVVPKSRSVYEFTPIQFPSDDPDSDWITTHFDFHSIHDNLLKLDFLGHLDPSIVRMLQNETGVDPLTIPMNDKEVLSLFKNSNALNYINDMTGEELGILGLPELGTKFVLDLVREAKPESFADLIRISGLSHGTKVWQENAQVLIKNGTANLKEVISTRDDIMLFLIGKGMDKTLAFQITESVRKGNGLTTEWEHSMRDVGVPDWYIDSCKKIEYMFPKAHATAYVMMAYRIAWYKINYPLEYYATYFSKRDNEFNIGTIVKGIDAMQKHAAELKAIPYREKTAKDNSLIDTYNIIFEMYSRGFEFENINIHKSRSSNFVINKETGKLIPPFSIVEGVGSTVAQVVTRERDKREYQSSIDFKNRSGLPGKILEKFEDIGVFNLEDKEKTTTQQLSLFE